MVKNIIHILNNLLLTFCVISLSFLVIITVIDVIGRYILGLPLPGASELTEIILAILIYIGLPYICRDEGHVTVSILSHSLKSNLSKLHSIIVNLLIGIILISIGIQLFLYGINLKSYNDITTFLEIPKAPIAFILSALSFLASFMNFLNCYQYLTNKKTVSSQNPEERIYASYKRPGIIESSITDKKER
tara:strand:- start:2888 stop:3457 length:570 start_codon:yes stop_codon:yes gene_type:complete